MIWRRPQDELLLLHLLRQGGSQKRWIAAFAGMTGEGKHAGFQRWRSIDWAAATKKGR
jgi:hypothetical protein